MLERDKFPLVSIIVITYNSAKFVVETLESCKAQTYQKIELIVSDDGSRDDTCSIVSNWLSNNSSRFIHHEFLTVSVNTGIPANCNRGIKASKGEWIKFIAGDDLLIDNAIESYLNNIIGKENSILFSYTHRYLEEFKVENFLFQFPKSPPEIALTGDKDLAVFQFDVLCKRNFVNAPTTFMRREVLERAGLFDENFPEIEDYPMWLKLTRLGYVFEFVPIVTVNHRVHSNATDSYSSNKLFKTSYFIRIAFFKKYVFPYVSRKRRLELQYEVGIRKLLNMVGLNRDTPFLRKLDFKLAVQLNPFGN